MELYKLGEMEGKLAELIWENAPVTTRKLVELCAEAFGWKRTTTYTMLKRLCDRGMFETKEGTVSALVSQEELKAAQGEKFVEETFGGSLPQFLAAFCRRKRLSREEVQEIQKLIDDYKGE